MITSAKNSDFANDYKIQDYSNTNLQGDCIVRFKIFTLDNSILKNKIGELNEVDKKEVMKKTKVQKVLHEFKTGTLHSGKGGKVVKWKKLD